MTKLKNNKLANMIAFENIPIVLKYIDWFQLFLYKMHYDLKIKSKHQEYTIIVIIWIFLMILVKYIYYSPCKLSNSYQYITSLKFSDFISYFLFWNDSKYDCKLSHLSYLLLESVIIDFLDKTSFRRYCITIQETYVITDNFQFTYSWIFEFSFKYEY